ncbi:hypothetical protein SAMN05216312_108158 [Cohnella sp. OV330]|uniref:hypothetical protein n=1 Tax=Cohnella sp. OV330 TaxID=1855288 RepID=UPI0008E36E2D|nr:hypothetical protein [Cohnella sp. OV330]SFB44465.1 hypothetical protein SAMN05216312_108158 [Cohnella sp. OV330]
MIKYKHSTGTEQGSFPPFPIRDEIVLTSVSLHGIDPGDEVVLRIEIGWSNPGTFDMGELEVILKKDDPNGATVEWSLESCFLSAVTRLEYRTTGGMPDQVYYLCVRSTEGLAVMNGPYRFEGRVET